MIQFKETKRTKGKLNADFKLKDTYTTYTKLVDEKLRVDKSTYIKINKSFLLKLREEILVNAETINLTNRLGKHRIRKKKTNLTYLKSLRIDWKKSKQYKTIIKHTNDHRNGYYYRWIWIKEGPIKNKSYYSFIPCRDNARLLSSLLQKYKMNKLDYLE